MNCREIVAIIEKRFPQSYALEWDNVGLQAGRADKEVKKILLALDADDVAVEKAVAEEASMLITHHPMIFKPLRKITDEDFIGRRLLTLIQHDISYYVMHTNYDVLGMADLAGEFLHMSAASVLEITKAEDSVEGIGRVADLKKPMTLAECAGWIKSTFGLPNAKVFGPGEMEVHRIAISPGSGKSIIQAALDKKADVLVTGDIDHHEGIDANAQGLMIIDAGHYGIEHIFMEDMKKFCEEKLPVLQIDTMPIRHPFWIA